MRQIDQPIVFGYRQWRLSQDVAPRTINREVGTLSNMLNKGVAWGRIGSNAIAGIKPLRHDTLAKQRRALMLAEVESIFEKSANYLKPVWRMFMCTEIRRSELVGIKFTDVDLDRKVVTVHGIDGQEP